MGDMFHWDSALPGFGLRVFATGRISWVVQYRTADRRQRRLALGDVRRLSLVEAKGKARELLAQVALGQDPQGDRHKVRQASRVIDLVDAYLEDAKRRRKPRSFIEIERSLRKAAAMLHHLRAERVERRDVVGLLNRIKVESGPFAANRVRAYLSAMWNWGIRSGIVDGTNPIAITLPPAAEKSRDRVLADAELALIWRCTGDGAQYSRIVRLLMLTAQRRDEIGSMSWDEISDSMLVLSANRTKNARSHEVPLSECAVGQLPPQGAGVLFGRSGNGFSAWSLSKARLDRRMLLLSSEDFKKRHGRSPVEGEVTLQPWRLHDLRRTFATWANEAGIEPHVVEAVLNHVSGAAKSGVAGVYNRATYRAQKLEALDRWANHIRRVVEVP
jgi:integrase